ncbi:LysR family transcriptional regulator [Stakelama sediminis]|uniref:DNA-binding transcriptional LysR family regulator n=1 Tax=Stakelama sediminis TaxID=463200 RepID=A0A840Z1M7_9SPHN|nr:LysR family transcriptional regulator [Stakelama sediminis]MBB5719592.1 DNA-binding transcriptional LysR family regulator [Stakelama sediminis]
MIQIDLNLLQTFDALYELRSTTRAADRLGLTQSAISHALRRLRDAVDDPLFVRSGRTLQPTARAIEMAPEVHAGLIRLRSALAPGSFDPTTVQRTITLAVGSYFCTLMAPQLIAWARDVAPGITIRLVPLDKELPAMLEAGAVDLAVGLFEHVPDRFVTETLFSDDFVWIAAREHPLIGRSIDRAELDACPRLQIGTVHPFGLPTSLIEIRQVSEVVGLQLPHERHPDAVVYEGLTAVAAVGASDLIAQVPRRLADRVGDVMGVRIVDAAEPNVLFTLSALWHSRLRQDAGILWLLDKLRAFGRDPDHR